MRSKFVRLLFCDEKILLLYHAWHQILVSLTSKIVVPLNQYTLSVSAEIKQGNVTDSPNITSRLSATPPLVIVAQEQLVDCLIGGSERQLM